MKTNTRKWLGSTPARCAVLLVIHALLQGWLAQRDVVAVIFSGGGTAPAWMVSATFLFAAIRLLVFFWIPAALAHWVVLHQPWAGAVEDRSTPSSRE